MNSITSNAHGSRFHDLLGEVFGPVGPSRSSLERRLLLVRSGVAYAGLVATLVQVVVWLMIGVISGHLDSPWWLWTAVPAAAVVAAATAVQRWHRWFAPAAQASKEDAR